MLKVGFLERPWALHVILSPLPPLLAMASRNRSDVSWNAWLWPFLALAGLVTLSWLILAFVTRNARTSGAVITSAAVAILSYSTIADLAEAVQIRQAVIAVYAAVLLLSFAILRFGGRARALTTFSNVFVVSACLLTAWPLLASGAAPPHFQRDSLRAKPAPNASGRSVLPDVYIVVLDGYGRADVLRERYGFTNTLVGDLESLGFFVAKEGASNYAQTAQSLASSLNLDYLHVLGNSSDGTVTPRQDFARLISDNRFFTLFDQAGYRIVSHASEYHLMTPGVADERRQPWAFWTDFGYSFYEATAVPRAFDAAGLPRGWLPALVHRRQVRWVLDQLERAPAAGDGSPTLVFAHVLLPHPPFVFEADGSYRASRAPVMLQDGNRWRVLAKDTGDGYEEGYVAGLSFLNTRLGAIVRAILARADRPTTIFLQGDHGPGSGLDWGSPQATDFRERLSTLIALRLAGQDGAALQAQLTPVNAMRVIANHSVDAGLALIADRSYYSTWNRPDRLLDVTHWVRSEENRGR